MAMSVGQENDEGSISDINTTPLVDVMLVLLIIFLITVPVIKKTIVTIPKAVNIPTQTKPENITIQVDKAGKVYWNDRKVGNRNELLGLVEAAAVKKPQPEVHIRGDKDAKYEDIGRVMYAIQRGSILKVGFLTEPDHGVRGYR